MRMIPSKALHTMDSAAKMMREKARMQPDGLTEDQARGAAEMMVLIKKEMEALEQIQSILKKAVLSSPESFEGIKEVTVVKGALTTTPAEGTSPMRALVEILGDDITKPGMVRLTKKAYEVIEARLGSRGPAGRRRYARLTRLKASPTHVRVNARD